MVSLGRPEKVPRSRHDEVLKGFFEPPPSAQSLVGDFMASGWAHELALATTLELPTEHIGMGGQARRSDGAWLVQSRDGRSAVACHVEFQSTVDPNMLLRSWEYVGHLYKFLRNNKEYALPGGGVPMVLSNVLYVGADPWDAPTTMAELAPPGSPTLARLQTRHHYRVLDIRSAREQDLPPEGSILRWLAELLRDYRVLPRLVEALAKDYGGPEHVGVRQGFAMVVEDAMLAARASEDAIRNTVNKVTNPREGGHMTWQMTEAFDEVRQEGRAVGRREGHVEGRAEGRAEGHHEGRVEGRAEITVRLAAQKFGTGTADQLRRVFASGKSEDVEGVADAILDCETGDELLARVKNGPSTD